MGSVSPRACEDRASRSKYSSVMPTRMLASRDGQLLSTRTCPPPVQERNVLTRTNSIIDKLSSSFPSDMPDLRASTNHLAPLKLPVQIAVYLPGRKDRVGFQVCRLIRVSGFAVQRQQLII